MVRLLLLTVLLTSINAGISEIVVARNCKELLDDGIITTGIYPVQPNTDSEPFYAYCDMTTLDGGWLYLINRIDGSISFARPWDDYKNGFGNIAKEFWLGLDHIHALTAIELNELLVELIDWDLNKYHIHYKAFSVTSEDLDYTLQVLGGYSGDLGDSLNYQAGMKFSTIDRNNDASNYRVCATTAGGGGWWYNDCQDGKLTGIYFAEDEAVEGNWTGMVWYGYHAQYPSKPMYYNFKEARMMIRPQSDHSLTYN